jgi:cysteine-rich repeat protein
LGLINPNENSNENCDDSLLATREFCPENVCSLDEAENLVFTKMGNGIIEESETCDDGNSIDGDGCNSKGEMGDDYFCNTSLVPTVCLKKCKLGFAGICFPTTEEINNPPTGKYPVILNRGPKPSKIDELESIDNPFIRNFVFNAWDIIFPKCNSSLSSFRLGKSCLGL